MDGEERKRRHVRRTHVPSANGAVIDMCLGFPRKRQRPGQHHPSSLCEHVMGVNFFFLSLCFNGLADAGRFVVVVGGVEYRYTALGLGQELPKRLIKARRTRLAGPCLLEAIRMLHLTYQGSLSVGWNHPHKMPTPPCLSWPLARWLAFLAAIVPWRGGGRGRSFFLFFFLSLWFHESSASLLDGLHRWMMQYVCISKLHATGHKYSVVRREKTGE